MQLAKQLDKLGTETAFAVSGAAAAWAAQGHRVYPFHLGDINIATPANITEATYKAIKMATRAIVRRQAFLNCAPCWPRMWAASAASTTARNKYRCKPGANRSLANLSPPS